MSDSKGKRPASFLEKFNTFRLKEKKDKDRKNADRGTFRPPGMDELVHDGSGDTQFQAAIGRLTEDEVNKKFESMLDDMNLSEEKKQPLRQRPVEVKRNMLAMQVKGTVQPKGKADNPEQFIVQLNNPELKLDRRQELLASLRVALTNNTVSWVTGFGVSGLNGILKNLTYCLDNKSERKSAQECVRCLKVFMNNKFGLMHIINHEEALTILARAIETKDPATMLEAIRLLAAICLVPPHGHDKALEGITICGELRGQERFIPIVAGLQPNDPPLNIACMQLINAIVSTPDDLDFRLHLRNEFMRTGLIDAVDRLALSDNEDVKTQVSCFQEHQEEDAEEFQHRYDNIRLEMDDPKECYDLLYQTTLQTIAEPFFLSILQHLLCIRDDVVARPQYYKLIEECVSQIVLHRSGVDPDFRYTRRFEIDVEPLIGKLSEDSVEEGSAAAGVAPRQFKSKLEEAITAKQEAEAKVATLDSKVKEYEKELADLKEKISQGISATVSAALVGGGGGGGVPGPPGPPGGGPPPPPPPPPPPGMGGPPPPPPPPPPGMPGMPGPPPPPPPPGMGGPPPPPPPGGTPRFGTPNEKLPHGMKAKKKYNPGVQMKRANWNKINVKQINKNSFWVKAAEEDHFESDDIFQALQSQFAAKAPAKMLDAETMNKPGKKGKELRVLDGKAGQNLSILLGSLKLPYKEIKRMIVEMDEEKLSLATVEQLIKYMPEADKMNKLAALGEEYSSLAEPEQFAVTMSSIKRITPRLKSLEFKMRFPELVQEVKPQIVAATAALEEVKQSKKFAGMLELILLLGNYMNAGSRNAQTVGFEISFITKLVNTKSQDNKTTFMHFLADTVEKKYPDILMFADELIHVDEAAKVSEEMVTSKISSMKVSIKQLETDMKNAGKDKNALPNDRFKEVMHDFVGYAKETHEVLGGMSKKMSSSYSEVAEYFAFDSKKYGLDEFMTDIKTFITQFQKALKENWKLRETEEKIRRAKEAKEKAERERKEKLARKKALVDITADDDQEGVMDNLLEALKTGSAFAVNRERKGERRRTPRAAGAERRAQLARSRSRQNIFQGQSPDVVRAISFDATEDDGQGTPQKPARNKEGGGGHRRKNSRDMLELGDDLENNNMKKKSPHVKKKNTRKEASNVNAIGNGEVGNQEDLLERLRNM